MSAQPHRNIDSKIFEAQMALVDGICGVNDIIRKYRRHDENKTLEGMAIRIYQLEKKLGIR